VSTILPRFIALPEVRRIVSLSKSQVYALIAAGGFPSPVKIVWQARRRGGSSLRFTTGSAIVSLPHAAAVLPPAREHEGMP